MTKIKLRATVNETALTETDRNTLYAAIAFLGQLEDRGMGEIVVTYQVPKGSVAPKAPREPKPERPKMTPSERGRAGALGLWGTKDNPKPRPVRRSRPKVPLHLKSVQPKMRAVWDALPEDGSYILIESLAEKLGIPPLNTRSALCLLKERGFAGPRDSNIKSKRGRNLVEWARTVEKLP